MVIGVDSERIKIMRKIFYYIKSLSLDEKMFLVFFCYGVGYVVGEMVKNLLG